MAGWGLHVGALALAPISLVQSVIAGGLVLLTVTADRLFAHEVTRREWIGVGLAALGLAFLAATLEGTGDEAHADYETGPPASPTWSWSARAAIAVAVAAIRNSREGVMLGRLRRPLLGRLGHLDQGALGRARRLGAGPRSCSARWRVRDRASARPSAWSSRRAACRSARRCR